MIEIVNNIIYTSLFIGGVSLSILVIEIFTAKEPIEKPYSKGLMTLSFLITASFVTLCISIIWRIWI